MGKGMDWCRPASRGPRDRRIFPDGRVSSRPDNKNNNNSLGSLKKPPGAATYLVARHGPAALGNQLGRLLVDGGLGGGHLVHSDLVEGSGGLDVLEGGLKVLELEVDLLLGGLGVLDGLDLEGVNGLDLALDVVGRGLELLEALLDLVDDGLVLERRPVLGEVDRGGQLREQGDLAAGVLVALLKGLERGDRLAAQAQRGGDLGPVELEGGAALWRAERERGKISS